MQVPSDQWGSGEAELKLELYSLPGPPAPCPPPHKEERGPFPTCLWGSGNDDEERLEEGP